MKRVLVTGADGFIGSHLVELLLKQNYEVRALSLYNSFNSWGWLEDIDKLDQVEVVTGDIRDPYLCKEITKNIDIVFHLAALIAIPYSYLSPESYVDTNVKGTLNICQSARENNCRMIHTSTSEVYGTARYVPIDEKHPLQPQSPYSASKIAADSIAMSFYHSFNLPLTIARPFNTYGPRQSARAIIPTIISQIGTDEKKLKLGDLTPTRDFNYVEDTCNGMIAMSKNDSTVGMTLNIGSNKEISIKDLATLIKTQMKSDIQIITDNDRIRPKNSEVQRLLCEAAELKKLTGHSPKYTLERGLRETIDWFSKPNNLKKYKANIYNV